MKKLGLILWCLFILTGCQKEIDVVVKNDGFQVEKIASLPKTEYDENGGIYNCGENLVCFNVEYIIGEHSEISVYQINLTNSSIKKQSATDKPNEFITFQSKDVEKGYVYEITYSLSDTEEVIALLEGSNDGTGTEKKSYIYQNENERTILYEYTDNEEKNNFDSQFIPISGTMAMDDDRSLIFVYVEDDQLAVDRIAAGKKITEERRIPLAYQDMKLTSFVTEADRQDIRVYENETKKMYVVEGKTLELNIKDTVTQINENTIIVQEMKNDEVSNYIYNFETEEKTEIASPLNGYIYADYDNQQNESSNWIFQPIKQELTDTNQFFSYGKIKEDLIELTELPFETEIYAFEFIDEKRMIFVSTEDPSSFDFYVVRME